LPLTRLQSSFSSGEGVIDESFSLRRGPVCGLDFRYAHPRTGAAQGQCAQAVDSRRFFEPAQHFRPAILPRRQPTGVRGDAAREGRAPSAPHLALREAVRSAPAVHFLRKARLLAAPAPPRQTSTLPSSPPP